MRERGREVTLAVAVSLFGKANGVHGIQKGSRQAGVGLRLALEVLPSRELVVLTAPPCGNHERREQ